MFENQTNNIMRSCSVANRMLSIEFSALASKFSEFRLEDILKKSSVFNLQLSKIEPFTLQDKSVIKDYIKLTLTGDVSTLKHCLQTLGCNDEARAIQELADKSYEKFSKDKSMLFEHRNFGSLQYF